MATANVEANLTPPVAAQGGVPVKSATDLRDVRPTRENIAYIAARLRKRDIDEMKDTGYESREWLWESFERGEVVFVAEYKGEPIGACVVCREPVYNSVLTPSHCISMIGTDKIASIGLGGVYFSLYNIRKLNAMFPYLFAWVRDDNRTATRYIEALGFKQRGGKTFVNGKPATYYEKIWK